MDKEKDRRKFVDTNIFIYAITSHPKYGEISRNILERIDRGEEAVTSIINIAEICWWLEKYGKKSEIEEILLLINSILGLEIIPVRMEDFLVASKFIMKYGIDFNDCLSLAVMKRFDVDTIYSNDKDFDKTWIKREFT